MNKDSISAKLLSDPRGYICHKSAVALRRCYVVMCSAYTALLAKLKGVVFRLDSRVRRGAIPQPLSALGHQGRERL